MHEVQTDLSLTQHGYLGYAVVVNHRFWQSLSASDQQLLSQTMRDALTYDNTIAEAQNDKALAPCVRAVPHAFTRPARSNASTCAPLWHPCTKSWLAALGRNGRRPCAVHWPNKYRADHRVCVTGFSLAVEGHSCCTVG